MADKNDKKASPFIAAMDTAASTTPTKTRGENGAPEYTVDGVGDPRVALFFKLVRGLDSQELCTLADKVVKLHRKKGDVQPLVDLFVMAFQTRATRGDGKGEKALFAELMAYLLAQYPQTVEKLVELIPSYGYFKDWSLLLEHLEAIAKPDDNLDATSSTGRPTIPASVRLSLESRILSLFDKQLTEDALALAEATKAGEHPTLSLAAKWCPREGRHYDALALKLAKRMFPDANDDAAARRLYRKQVAALNKALRTTEILMSAHSFESIDFKTVPSLCMTRQRKSFLNEKVKGSVKPEDLETGNRHPDDDDRVGARKKLRATLVESKLKGGQLQPHEIVSQAMRSGRLSVAETDVLDAQWRSLRESVTAQLAKAAEARDAEMAEAHTPREGGEEKGSPKRIDLGRIVPLVDVSGSMSGRPMEVAIALGILVSELTAPAFAHRVLTFESTPRWVELDPEAGVIAKTNVLQHAPWGGSTNFAAACKQILDAAVTAKLKPDEIPDLIIFSDMQFNEADGGGWATHLEQLQRKFNDAGLKVCGQPYPAPRLIFWNLRANTVGCPAQSDTPNTQMLSGFSPALLKLVLEGEELTVIEEERIGADGKPVSVNAGGPTPYETLRKALDNEAFDRVRAAIAEVGEGPFAGYEFETADGFTAV
jgi:Mg-chelatase subunit ChlD